METNDKKISQLPERVLADISGKELLPFADGGEKTNDKRTALTDKVLTALLLLLVGLAMIAGLVIAYNWMILHSTTLWKMFAIIGSTTFAGILFCLWILN